MQDSYIENEISRHPNLAAYSPGDISNELKYRETNRSTTGRGGIDASISSLVTTLVPPHKSCGPVDNDSGKDRLEG